MGKYRRRQETEFEALQWRGTNVEDIRELVRPLMVDTNLENDDLIVETTLYGMMRAQVGDWIMVGRGSPKVVADEVFSELYEPVYRPRAAFKVQAMQWVGDNLEEIRQAARVHGGWEVRASEENTDLLVENTDTMSRVGMLDWIVFCETGLRVVEREVFAVTYEESA